MTLSEHAAQYVQSNGLRAHTITSNCRRWERITGITDVARITTPGLRGFREACLALQLAHDTIEKTITDVLTIVKHVTGVVTDHGKRLQNKRPNPKPVPIADLELIFAASPDWLQKWIVLDYWTAARLSDSVDVFLIARQPADMIVHQASKTSLVHRWPVPRWLGEWMRPVDSPIRRNTLHFRKVIEFSLARCCDAAGVPIVTPKQLRQRSITEWTRANATAGAIVHGCGLGVMAHYLDPLSVLESAAPRVRLPACFGATPTTSTDTLVRNFGRMDPAAQQMMVGLSERLAAG